MPLCRDVELLRPFIAKNRPATNSIANLVDDTFGSRVHWIRVDDTRDPHAVLCRTRRFTLYADSGPAAARVLAEVPRNMRMVFSATPTRFCRMTRENWRGPDAGRRMWYNHCYLYALKPGRLVINQAWRVSRLRPGDAPAIARNWPYGRSADHVLNRIRNGPGYCVRRKGKPVAWGLTHDDGSMGFLHVVEAFRGQGMARALTTALARRLLSIGVQPFMYIVTGNSASIRLTESMDFTRAGRFSWFGTR